MLDLYVPSQDQTFTVGQTTVTDAISEGNSAILVAPFILTVLNNTDGNSLSFYVLRWIGLGTLFTLVPGSCGAR